MEDYDLTNKYNQALQTNIVSVIPGLYIGNILSRKCIEEYEIAAVISLTDDHLIPLDVPEYNFLMHDTTNEDEDDINEILDDTSSIITRTISGDNNNILIHCTMGISRSATVVIDYLMSKYNLDYDDSLNILRKVRFCVQPNPLFERILRNRHSKEIMMH